MNKKHLTNQGEKELIAQDNISKVIKKTKLKKEILSDDDRKQRK